MRHPARTLECLRGVRAFPAVRSVRLLARMPNWSEQSRSPGSDRCQLLQQHADVNVPEPDGATALHWAAYWDNSDLVAQLLKLGANPGLSNDLGVTPLGLASANGNAAVVDALLSAGADTRVSQGIPPLMSAAHVGSVDAVKALLAHGADVNGREPGANQTALMWAVAQRHDAVVAVLAAASR